MAFEQEDYFSREWNSIGSSMTETEKKNCDSCFDCNICLDFAHEPVVTLCGHLFCWSCIYKWLYVQSASLAPDEPPQCPVCKHEISHTKMVPLYGRGQTAIHRDDGIKTTVQDVSIPPRPPASGIQSLFAMATLPQRGQQELAYRNPYQTQNINQENDATQMLNLMTPVFPHFIFGDSPSSDHVNGSGSSRWRRQEMLANKSLNRISFFLFLCFVLCLIFF
ncbi:unnamed protein product [Vicia faba]|uniref:E3 ubiquitin-protein ligase RMA n=1 Tax=Vicia faba TaxID=3906 RepID=A0AAV1B9D5_VICFA|nr:unnamed protein product [Vicia faba]